MKRLISNSCHGCGCFVPEDREVCSQCQNAALRRMEQAIETGVGERAAIVSAFKALFGENMTLRCGEEREFR